METLTTTDDDWAFIESKLPDNWRALAKAHGILTHTDGATSAEVGTGGWKLRDPGILLRLLLSYVVTNAALKTTVAIAAAIGRVDLSAVALHTWTRKAGGWIAARVAARVGTTATFARARWAGYDVVGVDATTVQKPGAKGTTARVHYALRRTDLRAMAIYGSDATVGETLRNFGMAAGQLWIADRGDSNANRIAHAIAAHADVLIRFALGPLPLFDATGGTLDTRARIRSVTTAGSPREFPVWVRPQKADPIEARLIVVRLPQDKAAEARKRLYKEHTKAEVSALMLEMASYVVLITTVPRTRLTTLQLLAIDKLRWQLELSFKRDKSIAGLDQLPSHLPETIHCWICTKLLATQLARRMAESDEPFPPSVVGHYALSLRPHHLAAYAARSRRACDLALHRPRLDHASRATPPRSRPGSPRDLRTVLRASRTILRAVPTVRDRTVPSNARRMERLTPMMVRVDLASASRPMTGYAPRAWGRRRHGWKATGRWSA